MFYFSIGLTIIANVFYHIAQKSIPQNVNPLVSVTMSYVISLILSMLVLPFFPNQVSLIQSVKELNWGTYVVGAAIVAVEIGFLLAYRAGWNISLGAVSANVAVTLMLIPIGLLFFQETLTTKNVAGIVLCVAGLWMVTTK